MYNILYGTAEIHAYNIEKQFCYNIPESINSILSEYTVKILKVE